MQKETSVKVHTELSAPRLKAHVYALSYHHEREPRVASVDMLSLTIYDNHGHPHLKPTAHFIYVKATQRVNLNPKRPSFSPTAINLAIHVLEVWVRAHSSAGLAPLIFARGGLVCTGVRHCTQTTCRKW